MKNDEADAAFEEAEESFLLFFGDVLNHVVKNDGIEVVEVRFVIGVGRIFGVRNVREGGDVRVLIEHFVERFFLETMTAGDHQDARPGRSWVG